MEKGLDKINSKEIKVRWNENRKKDYVNKNFTTVNPAHYQQGKIEVIDFILDQKMSYLTASACKYLCRWEHKHLGEGRLDDLRKARWFIEKQIEEILKEENIK